ncbi:MAG: hypothetical protein DI635_04080 [Pseudoxanthomonas suwonensis]|nr:MAG: hypothetical protein DI635_04080 [Pseudoxanthomonas suwonensis]
MSRISDTEIGARIAQQAAIEALGVDHLFGPLDPTDLDLWIDIYIAATDTLNECVGCRAAVGAP